MPVRLKPLFVTALMVCSLATAAGLAAQEPTLRCDPPAGSLGKLTQVQKKAFMESQDRFLAGRFTDALEELRGLLAQSPQNTPAQTALAERAAEAAIEAGERAYAISLLKPIEERDGSDCLARALLARADAENGQAAERDAELSALTALHKKAPKSPAGKLDAFLLEKHSVKGGGSVEIWYVLRPWGLHHTYISSDILDASGESVLHIELDSDDGDQVSFKQSHPDLVAKGERCYSLDAFASNKALPDPTADHHALIQFFDGAPSYDTVRERILAIAERSAKLAA